MTDSTSQYQDTRATVTTAPPERQHVPVAATDLTAALDAAHREIDAVESIAMISLQVREAASLLRKKLDEAVALPKGAAAYRTTEILEATSLLRQVSSREAAGAMAQLMTAKQDLRDLSQIPRATDAGEAVEDREVRDRVGAMTAKEQRRFLDGSHPRVLLALARDPMEGDLQKAAADAYSTTSDPVRRGIIGNRIEIAKAGQASAEQLAKAIDATRTAIEVSARSRASRAEIERISEPRPSVTSGEEHSAPMPKGVPTQYDRATVSSPVGPSVVQVP